MRRQTVALPVCARFICLLFCWAVVFSSTFLWSSFGVDNVFLTDGCAFCSPRTKHKTQAAEERESKKKKKHASNLHYIRERAQSRFVSCLAIAQHIFYSYVFFFFFRLPPYATYALMLQRAACFSMSLRHRRHEQNEKKKKNQCMRLCVCANILPICIEIEHSLVDGYTLQNLLAIYYRSVCSSVECIDMCVCVCVQCFMSHAYHP